MRRTLRRALLKENIVTDAAVEIIILLPVMEDFDGLPSVDELRKAINGLACVKTLGNDDIPPEVIKAGKNTVLVHHLHDLLLQCWKEQ